MTIEIAIDAGLADPSGPAVSAAFLFAAGDVSPEGLPQGEPVSEGLDPDISDFPHTQEICAPVGDWTALAFIDFNDGQLCTTGDYLGTVEVTVEAGGNDVGTLTVDTELTEDCGH
ncbi:MAG: hypothetical protein GY898_21590 [Proteobacteria bacterium]|nr:hypothetical protein [Pseudomonadota bacterium]